MSSGDRRAEGMVTVYDDHGRYAGCMGNETWQWLLDHPEVDAVRLAAAETENQRLRDALEWLRRNDHGGRLHGDDGRTAPEVIEAALRSPAGGAE